MPNMEFLLMARPSSGLIFELELVVVPGPLMIAELELLPVLKLNDPPSSQSFFSTCACEAMDRVTIVARSRSFFFMVVHFCFH